MKICPHCLEISHADARCDVCGGDVGETSGAVEVPHLDDGFVLDAGPPLGQGSFAEVRAATSRVDGSRWAIKLVDLQRAATSARVRKQLRASFLREASALTVLRHPHIVTVQAFGARDADTLFMAMEFIPGGQTLQRVLARAADKHVKPGLNTILRVLEEVGAALAYIHERSLVHRDLKPANIGVDASRRFKLLDFGLVKVVDEGFGPNGDSVTVAGWGSYNYGAPEQFFQGVIGPWTDIYALGAIVYEMISGRPPVCEGTLERILERMNRPAEPLPEDRERPLALTDLVMDMLQKCPADRPQTMGEVQRRVRSIRQALARAEAAGAAPASSDERLPHAGLVAPGLDASASPTPAPRVTVIRTRRGAETRPASPEAVDLISATKAQSGPLELPPLDLSVDPGAAGRGSESALEAVPPPRPLALALAGVAAVLIGLVGLWWTIRQT
jgi:serine/threonine protein kinase